MKVLSVASECAPLVKTGGLADVVGALPTALAREGVAMRVMLPAYPGLAARLHGAERHRVPLGREPAAEVIAGRATGLDLLLVDAPRLFDREGAPYTREDGSDWPDNALRFGHLARVAAAVAARGLAGWRPDAVHAHDWQTGLVPVYVRETEGGGPPVLMTIHNMAYQGLFEPEVLGPLGLPTRLMQIDGVEFWGKVGFLKAGLAAATRISTVSPGYARELLSPAFGLGLEGLLEHRREMFCGILNGIDTDLWDPSRDPALAARYDAADPSGKAANRAALAARFALTAPADALLFVVVSRMTAQKGLDLLLDALPALLGAGAALAVLGSGEAALEAAFAGAARAHPGRVGFVAGYDEPLSRLMIAGGDAILVPSRFEPCGLTQLYGLRYGTLPVVARTGGLADTVIDANDAALRAGVATGFVHEPGRSEALAEAIRRAAAIRGNRPAWRAMRAAAMRHPVGWATSAAAYAALYRGMVSP